jgi:multimeric flavodoxin WrbA
MSAILLFASSRRHGNTGKLADRVASALNIELVDLSSKNISVFDYEHRNRGDDFEPLLNHVLGFDKILFASPEYWYAVSPPMKIFLDRISDYLDIPDLLDQGRKLRGKSGFVLCTSVYDAPSPPFIGAFTRTFEYLGLRYGGCLHANCKNGYDAKTLEPAALEFMAKLQ